MSAIAVLHIVNLCVASSPVPVPTDDKSGADLPKEIAGHEPVYKESWEIKSLKKVKLLYW